jgi:hypothetical protein
VLPKERWCWEKRKATYSEDVTGVQDIVVAEIDDFHDEQ